jgi:hypothetical protein
MSGHDPFDALSVTDPRPEDDPTRDDSLLARIVATPLAQERRHLSHNQRIAIAVATPLVLAGAGFTYAQVTRTDVDDAGLRPLVLEARRDVPLPPGVQWSQLSAEIMGPNTRTNGPEMAQNIVLGEAQCQWERYWVDSAGNPSRLTTAEQGYGQIVERMHGKPWMSELLPWAEKAGARARSGDTSLFRQNLSVNCTPAQGGSATTVSYVELSLREIDRPAVALLFARSDADTLPTDAELSRFETLVKRTERALTDAGAGPEPDAVTTDLLGRDYLTSRFFVADLAKAVPVVQRLAAQEKPATGSFLMIWDGKTVKRNPIS